MKRNVGLARSDIFTASGCIDWEGQVLQEQLGVVCVQDLVLGCAVALYIIGRPTEDSKAKQTSRRFLLSI